MEKRGMMRLAQHPSWMFVLAVVLPAACAQRVPTDLLSTLWLAGRAPLPLVKVSAQSK